MTDAPSTEFSLDHLNKFVEIAYKQPESHKVFRMAGRLLGYYDNGKGTEWWMAKTSARRYAVEFTVTVLDEPSAPSSSAPRFTPTHHMQQTLGQAGR